MLAVNNFFADLTALTAVSIFLKKPLRARRLIAGAAAGTAGSCLAFVLCSHMAAYLLFVHFVLNPLILYFSFREKNKKDLFTDLCAGYFVFLLFGGIMEWLYADGSGFFSYGAAFILTLALLAAALAWAVRQYKNRGRYVEASICCKGSSINLKAVSDSGNLLKDPYTGRPVSMIDREIFCAAYGPPKAVRFIPYESLGCRHGLLEAVTIEELSFAYGNQKVSVAQAVLGLAEHALFEKKPYQMIINPQELSACRFQEGGAGRGTQEKEMLRQKAELQHRH